MSFDEKLREMIDTVEVPDELKPENIAIMLKSKSQNQVADKSAVNRKKITMSATAKKKAVITRAVALSAACVALVTGVFAISRDRQIPDQIEGTVDYKAVTPDNYDELYKIYTGICLEDKEKEQPEINDVPDNNSVVTSEIPEKIAEVPIEPVVTEPSEPVVYNSDSTVDDASSADIIKNDKSHLYYISGNKVCIVSLESMEVISQIEKADSEPFEMYIEGDKLILISKAAHKEITADSPENIRGSEDNAIVTTTTESVPAETAESQQTDISDENSEPDVIITETSADNANIPEESASSEGKESIIRANIVVDEYDISDRYNPQLITEYKQNGDYISSHMVDGSMYLVTVYSDYRIKPLEKEADLDSFVPAYYINNEKYYVAAGDIIIPANPGTTDYTVISRADCTKSSITPSVKAVLGMSRNVYCSADTLYVVENAADKSIITSLDLKGGLLDCKASASVYGSATKWMNSYSSMLRVVIKVEDNGVAAYKVLVLDDKLSVVNESDVLLAGQNITAVKFFENYISFMTGEDKTPVCTIDLSCNPPVQAEALEGSSSSVITNYDENRLLSFGIECDENGNKTAVTLSMLDESGEKLNCTAIEADAKQVCSTAFSDKRSVFTDSEKGIVAVPVYSHNEFGTKNQYFVYSYDDSAGFTAKGVIEYNDVDDSYIFERAVIVDDVFYAIAKGRIVSAQLSDLKVIDSFTF